MNINDYFPITYYLINCVNCSLISQIFEYLSARYSARWWDQTVNKIDIAFASIERDILGQNRKVNQKLQLHITNVLQGSLGTPLLLESKAGPATQKGNTCWRKYLSCNHFFWSRNSMLFHRPKKAWQIQRQRNFSMAGYNMCQRRCNERNKGCQRCPGRFCESREGG